MSDYGFSIKAENLVSSKMAEIDSSIHKTVETAKVGTKEVAEHFEVMGEKMGETFKNLKGLLLSGLGITALFEGWEFIEKSKEAFEGLEKAVTRVDTVLASTKFAAGFSSEDIQNQAKELSKVIVAKRDEILDAQGMLLSFHDIRGNTFKETTKTVADFATFFKESMTDAALQVGKAINDPLKGMTRLQRMGVEFSNTQKEAIKNYVAQGNLVGAQAVILKELNTEFGGQAQAFALTDAGKIQIAAKQWEELQFRIGEVISKVEVSLIPAFTKVVNAIKETFNSSVIQFFIEHIKDLVSIALKLIPIWLAYKAVMFANATITSVFAVENGVLTASLGELTVMTDGATFAFEGFKSVLSTIGFGAFIAGIGLGIEKIISLNKQLEDTIDKKYRLTPNKEAFEEFENSFSNIQSKMETIGAMGSLQKSALLSDVLNQIKDIEEKKPQLVNDINKLHKGAEESKKHNSRYSSLSGYVPFGKGWKQNTIDDNTKEADKTMNQHLKELNNHLATLNKIVKNPAFKGIKPLSAVNPGEGIAGDATHTSNLSGANGGLGQSKIIQIHIQTLQQNNGVKESKTQADEAVEKLTEMLNAFSDSQNAQ